MAENIKIGILGGDRRQLVMAQCLSESFECAVWGFDKIYGTADEEYLKKAVRCADWESAVKCSDAVILPLPASSDGKNLNCPLAKETEFGAPVPLTSVCEKLQIGSLLLGGMLPSIVKSYAAEHGVCHTTIIIQKNYRSKTPFPRLKGQ